MNYENNSLNGGLDLIDERNKQHNHDRPFDYFMPFNPMYPMMQDYPMYPMDDCYGDDCY